MDTRAGRSCTHELQKSGATYIELSVNQLSVNQLVFTENDYYIDTYIIYIGIIYLIS